MLNHKIRLELIKLEHSFKYAKTVSLNHTFNNYVQIISYDKTY